MGCYLTRGDDAVCHACVNEAKAEGAAQAEARIVAYVREQARLSQIGGTYVGVNEEVVVKMLADAIEVGEHNEDGKKEKTR